MLLWILSDIHVELTRGWDLAAPADRPNFDALVIAGDLIPRMERGARWLRERVSDRPVIYIGGNHEAYGTDIDRTFEKAKQAAAGTNVHVLQNETTIIGNVTFAGATMWTDFSLFGDAHRAMAAAADQMNDFRRIRIGHYVERFRPTHALVRHKQSRNFIESELRKVRVGPLVIVTHHAPIPGILPAIPITTDDALIPTYRSDLTALMHPAPDDGRGPLRPADLWIFGHTHEFLDVLIGETRVVSNAKGYGPWPRSQTTWDNPHFDPNFVVEV